MDQSEPILILAKNWNQFKAGESWLWDNKLFSTRRPIFVTTPRQLAGLRGTLLFIMDEAEFTDFAVELAHTNFAHRNRIFDMQDLRSSQGLQFKITERITNHGYPFKDL